MPVRLSSLFPCLFCALFSLSSFSQPTIAAATSGPAADDLASDETVGTSIRANRLSEVFPGVDVARCMFPQGKLVVQSGELFHVLRKGDSVPGQPGVRVLEITDRHAVLIQGPKGSGPVKTTQAVPIPDRLVKIEKRLDGEVTVTVLSARMPRAVGPELLEQETIYSPWSEDGGKVVYSGSGDGSEGEPAMAPLVAPRQVETPETGAQAQKDENGGEQ